MFFEPPAAQSHSNSLKQVMYFDLVYVYSYVYVYIYMSYMFKCPWCPVRPWCPWRPFALRWHSDSWPLQSSRCCRRPFLKRKATTRTNPTDKCNRKTPKPMKNCLQKSKVAGARSMGTSMNPHQCIASCAAWWSRFAASGRTCSWRRTFLRLLLRLQPATRRHISRLSVTTQRSWRSVPSIVRLRPRKRWSVSIRLIRQGPRGHRGCWIRRHGGCLPDCMHVGLGMIFDLQMPPVLTRKRS